MVAVSLMMSNQFKLRVINLIGAILFTIYGALLTPPAIPVVIVNGLITCTNIYFLYKMSRRRDFFRTLPIIAAAPFVTHFMRYYAEDIKSFFPRFDWEKEKRKDPSCLFLLRGTNPVGIFIYEVRRKSVAVLVDYVVPEYRDMKNAQFLFTVLTERFLDKGKTEYIIEDIYNVKHCKYLRGLGFKRDPKRPEVMYRPFYPSGG